MGGDHIKKAMGNKETGMGKWDNRGMGLKPIRRIRNWNFLLVAMEDIGPIPEPAEFSQLLHKCFAYRSLFAPK